MQTAAHDTAVLPPEPVESQSRKVVYAANVTLAVMDKASARDAIERIAERMGGFILSSTFDQVTFRVKPENFRSAIEGVSSLGEVLVRDIRSDDVTAQYYDIELRIDVAEGTRKRLMEIIKNSGTVKDILEVEKEIRRLTEEIEQMKGNLRLMKDRVDWATVTVSLEQKILQPSPTATPTPTPSPTPLPHEQSGRLFGWMDGIGLEQTMAPLPHFAKVRPGVEVLGIQFGRHFSLGSPDHNLLPRGFVPMMAGTEDLIGATAEDYRLRARRIELDQPSDLEFWRRAVSDELGIFRRYNLKSVEDAPLENNRLEGLVFRCAASFNREAWNYDLWLIQKKKNRGVLMVVEYARSAREADAHIEDVEKAIRGIELD
ncbi:DUF4349 domain-containing protein [Candidatus Sumerlaeota bacterium]|nr:DUF4349 domain-containing protein [Candidatus Sumerlaeota bacterium]